MVLQVTECSRRHPLCALAWGETAVDPWRLPACLTGSTRPHWSEQGLSVTGTHLMGENKFTGLVPWTKFKVQYIFYRRFLNTPFPQKLKRRVWNAILYFKLNTEQLSTIFTYIVFPPNYVSFDTPHLRVVTSHQSRWALWRCSGQTHGRSQAADGKLSLMAVWVISFGWGQKREGDNYLLSSVSVFGSFLERMGFSLKMYSLRWATSRRILHQVTPDRNRTASRHWISNMILTTL